MRTIKVLRLPVRTGMAMAATLAIALGAFSPAHAGAAPAGIVPTMSVSPGAGPAGSLVVVSGTLGRSNPVLPPSERVTIYFDRTRVGNTYTDWFRSFSTAISIPANASPGAHMLLAKSQSGEYLWAIFTVSGTAASRTTAANPRPDPR